MAEMKRVVIYFMYLDRPEVPEYIFYKLDHLRPFAQHLHVVVNGLLLPNDLVKLNEKADHVMVRENLGMDVGAYKDSILDIGFDKLAEFDELILMNHTWFGPIGSFSSLFEKTDKFETDLWGITDHAEVRPNPYGRGSVMRRHIQSHWIAVRNPVLRSRHWQKYWLEIPYIESYEESILKHESVFTGHFEDLGYKSKVLFPASSYQVDNPGFTMAEQLLKDGSPILKRRPFFHDPLYLDYEAIIGSSLLKTAEDLKYPVDLVWDSIIGTTQPKILHTNLALLAALPDVEIQSSKFSGRIGISMHVYYVEMLDELFTRCSYLPGIVDLYITTQSLEKKDLISFALSNHTWKPNHFEIRIVESNRGRDMSAFFITNRDLIFNDSYDLLVKIHTKKSVQAGKTRGEFFKKQQLENLLNSPGYSKNLISLFTNDEKLGAVFPPMIHIGHPTLGNAWFTNRKPAEEFAKRLGITVPLDDMSPLAPFGGMFICRPVAIRPMASVENRFSDYFPEDQYGDGSLAHIQERFLAYSAASAGYKTMTVSNLEHLAVSHTLLEYKLERMMQTIPGFALHSANRLAQSGELDNSTNLLSRVGFLKLFLKLHFPRTANALVTPWSILRRVRNQILR